MIIACPACATRYVVPDSAIGLEGRTVRCAKCKHSWFQDGPEVAEPIAVAYGAPAPAKREASVQPAARSPSTAPTAAPPPGSARTSPPAAESPSAPPPPQPTSLESDGGGSPAGEPPPLPPQMPPQTQADTAERFDDLPASVDWAAKLPDEEHLGDDPASPFDHSPPFRPRRNWVRWATWGAGLFAALALTAIAAMAVWGTPSWLPVERPLFGTDPGLKVDFPPSEQERRQLPNGAEFFGARVIVTNETRETKRVPPLLIVLRDARKRIVYSWELVPPQRTLAPGEAMTINEAMTDVPRSADYADIGWAPR